MLGIRYDLEPRQVLCAVRAAGGDAWKWRNTLTEVAPTWYLWDGMTVSAVRLLSSPTGDEVIEISCPTRDYKQVAMLYAGSLPDLAPIFSAAESDNEVAIRRLYQITHDILGWTVIYSDGRWIEVA